MAVSSHMKPEVIRMVRLHMRAIPRHPIPQGFRIRFHEEGDAATWLRIQQASEPSLTIDRRLFEREFANRELSLAERCLFLVAPDGTDIGTGVAWERRYTRTDVAADLPAEAVFEAVKAARTGQTWGCPSWVAIHPSYQGRGLSRPLLSALMLQLEALSYDRCMTLTSTDRAAAIKAWLHFGFRPELRNEAVRKAWASLWQP